MKKLGLILLALISVFSFASCISEADLQVLIDEITPDMPESVSADFELPVIDVAGVTLTWTISENTFLVLDENGHTVHVTVPLAGVPDQTVTFTATLAAGSATATATFDIVVDAPDFTATSIDTYIDALSAAIANASASTSNGVTTFTIGTYSYTTDGANMTVTGTATSDNNGLDGTITVTNNANGVVMEFVMTDVTSANNVATGGTATITVTSGSIEATWTYNFATGAMTLVVNS